MQIELELSGAVRRSNRILSVARVACLCALGVASVALSSCTSSTTDATGSDPNSGEEAPLLHEGQDGVLYGGRTAEEVREEENPGIPEEIFTEEYMAELFVPQEDYFAPMLTTDPAILLDLYAANMNCIATAPHPKLQELCIRAVSGDERNQVSELLLPVAENWFRRRLAADTSDESPGFSVEVVESSVLMDRPIHDEQSVEFLVIQTQESPRDERTVRLVFERDSVQFLEADIDAFRRMGRSQLGVYEDVWVLTGYYAAED